MSFAKSRRFVEEKDIVPPPGSYEVKDSQAGYQPFFPQSKRFIESTDSMPTTPSSAKKSASGTPSSTCSVFKAPSNNHRKPKCSESLIPRFQKLAINGNGSKDECMRLKQCNTELMQVISNLNEKNRKLSEKLKVLKSHSSDFSSPQLGAKSADGLHTSRPESRDAEVMTDGDETFASSVEELPDRVQPLKDGDVAIQSCGEELRSLRELNASLIEEVHTLTEKLDCTVADLTHLIQEKTELEEEALCLTQCLDTVSRTCQDREHEVELLTANNAAAELHLEDLRSDMHSLHVALEHKEAELIRLLARKESIEIEVNRLRAQAEQPQGDVEHWKDALNVVESHLAVACAERDVNAQELYSVMAKLEELGQQHAELLEERRNAPELQQDIQAREEELKQLRASICELSDQLSSLQVLFAEKEKVEQELLLEVDRLTEEIRNSKSMEDDISLLNGKLKEKEVELADSNVCIVDMRGQLQSSCEEREKLLRDHEKVMALQKSESSKYLDVTSELAAKQSELQTALEEGQRLGSLVDQQANQMECQLLIERQIAGELERRTELCAQLENENTIKSNELLALHMEMTQSDETTADLRKSVLESEAHLLKVNEELAEREKFILELERKLAVCSEDSHKLESCALELKTVTEQLELTKAEKQREEDELDCRVQLRAFKSQYDIIIEEAAESSARNAELESELKDCREEWRRKEKAFVNELKKHKEMFEDMELVKKTQIDQLQQLRQQEAFNMQCLKEELLTMSNENEVCKQELSSIEERFCGQLSNSLNDKDRYKNLYEELLEKMRPFQTQLDQFLAEREILLGESKNAEKELKELNLSFAKMLGHQNHKQKIHYLTKVKEENLQLKAEASYLRQQVKRYQLTTSRQEDELNKLEGRQRFDPSKAFQFESEEADKEKENEIPDQSLSKKTIERVRRFDPRKAFHYKK